MFIVLKTYLIWTKPTSKLEKTKLPLLNGSSWKLQSWCHAARKEYIIYQLPPWKYMKNFSEVKKSKGLLHFTLILILNCDFAFIFLNLCEFTLCFIKTKRDFTPTSQEDLTVWNGLVNGEFTFAFLPLFL